MADRLSDFKSTDIKPSSNPIGVLDSGLGGLSVLSALRQTLPLEDFVYCADCGNAPWGDKSPEFVIDRCRDICRYLIEVHHAKCIVLACNTATALGADVLRREFTLPIVGIEPAVKPAVAASRTHTVGVIATRGTIESDRYQSLLTRFAQNSRVISVGAPGLMECVEKGDFSGPQTRALLEKYLLPLKAQGIDKLVLGCTHYPFLSETIARILGPQIELIEPGKAVAAVTQKRLIAHMLERKANDKPREIFFVRGLPKHLRVLQLLWPAVQTASIKPSELKA